LYSLYARLNQRQTPDVFMQKKQEEKTVSNYLHVKLWKQQSILLLKSISSLKFHTTEQFTATHGDHRHLSFSDEEKFSVSSFTTGQ